MTGLAGFTGGLLGDVAITAVLYGSGGNALTTDSTAVFTGMSTGVAYAANVDAVAVVTSQQGVRTLWGSQLYGNGGNDSIALGQQVTSLTGTTLVAVLVTTLLAPSTDFRWCCYHYCNLRQLVFTRIPSSKVAAVTTQSSSKALLSPRSFGYHHPG